MLSFLMNKSNFPDINTMSIENVFLKKFFLNLLESKTTNIAKDIFIIPAEEIHKNNTW